MNLSTNLSKQCSKELKRKLQVTIYLSIIFSLFQSVLQAQSISLSNVASYQRHSDLTWKVNNLPNVKYYNVMQSIDGQSFAIIKKVTNLNTMVFTSVSKLDTLYYYIEAIDALNKPLAATDTVIVIESEMSDPELMDMVQRYTFKYFWDDAHPTSGMARERNNSGDVVTTGGSGFALMAILVGIENGYITRDEGLDRIIKILSFLQFCDRFQGAYPHWLNGKTGKVVPFSTKDDGGDLVETALLMQGLLTVRQFFDRSSDRDKAIRDITAKLYEEVKWDHYTKNNSGVLYWHWSPTNQWQINLPIRGYNEALIVYLLAIASPTHPINASYWKSGWTSQNYKNGNSWYGHKLYVGPSYGGPLFFAHYSFLGFDPRNLKDGFCNYFTQNRNHSLINRGYCIQNPLNHKKYGSSCWGLTACDGPNGYNAFAPGSGDNGTIAPTAALSSMPYTPTESIDALRYFYFEEGEKLFDISGFHDAFNPTKNWYADSYLAIDQGPIIAMIQNHRTGLLWKNFMQNPEIKPALDKIGFVPDVSSSVAEVEGVFSIFPNPTDKNFTLSYDGALYNITKIEVTDIGGKVMKTIEIVEPGRMIDVSDISRPGVYLIKVYLVDTVKVLKLVISG
jgi:hypothetical protein